jgi:hypothetical protein
MEDMTQWLRTLEIFVIYVVIYNSIVYFSLLTLLTTPFIYEKNHSG